MPTNPPLLFLCYLETVFLSSRYDIELIVSSLKHARNCCFRGRTAISQVLACVLASKKGAARKPPPAAALAPPPPARRRRLGLRERIRRRRG
jgi:hypothetical protein